METGYARLTVYFEDPFWVGLFLRGGGGTWEACKVTFGPEPKDCEVYAFLLENHRRRRPPTPNGASARSNGSWSGRGAAPRPSRPWQPTGNRAWRRKSAAPGRTGSRRRPANLPCAGRSGGRSTGDTEAAAREKPPSGHSPGGGLFPLAEYPLSGKIICGECGTVLTSGIQ